MAPFVQVAWPLSAPVEVGGPIAAGADDVYWDSDAVFEVASTYFGVGQYETYTYNAAGRWALPIPQGATILSATLTITSRGSAGTVNTVIKAHAADNSAAITSYADATSRARTTASVNWTPGAWTNGVAYTSPDLASVIQEVVNRAGWASGNYLTLFWEYVSSGASQYRDGSDYEHTGAAPVLTVTYQASAPPPASGIAWGTPVTMDTAYAMGPTSINIPANLNGKLCVVFFRTGRNPVYLDIPSGWERVMASSTNSPMGAYYRVCDGTEGSSISIGHFSDAGLTTGTQSSFVTAAYAVTGVATNEAAFLEAVFAALSNDPPSLTPSWGSAENEWVVMYGSRYNDWAVSAFPTNYEELITNISARTVSIDYAGIAVGRRTLTAASENPDAFTITPGGSGLSSERAMTLALRPAPSTGIAIRDSVANVNATRATSVVMDLPTYQAGDLVVINLRVEQSTTTVTPQEGWTQLLTRQDAGSARTYYRVMQAGDGSTFTLTLSTSRRVAWNIYALSGVATSESAFIEGNIGAGLDPASLTPSWGSAANLWITFGSLFDPTDSLTLPANYASQLTAATVMDVNGARIASAHRFLTAASEDPGAWAQGGSTSTNPHSGVIAVRPA